MINELRISGLLAFAWCLASTASLAADDWSFVTGSYAVSAKDCAHLGRMKSFSKPLAKALGDEVLTREGITSPRETHCRFRSSAKEGAGWKIKAQCEELGSPSPELDTILVTATADGTLTVRSEDVFGPSALVFRRCAR